MKKSFCDKCGCEINAQTMYREESRWCGDPSESKFYGIFEIKSRGEHAEVCFPCAVTLVSAFVKRIAEVESKSASS